MVLGQKQQIIADDWTLRPLQIDQTHLEAKLSFEPKEGRINGQVNLSFINTTDSLDSIWLDGVNMNILEVKMNDQPLRFIVEKKGVSVFFETQLSLNTNHIISYTYSATPKRGMYFIGWKHESDEFRKQIWTQGQGIDNRHWIPHVDAQHDKLTTTLEIAFPKEYTVVSNGELTSRSNKNGMSLWHYEMTEPHSSYLMMIAIGLYDKTDQKSKNGVVLENYMYPDWHNRYASTYYKNEELFDAMVKEVGVPYPWANYKQVPVKDFQHGAMENTSATIFGDFYCTDDKSFHDDPYIRVNAHELAHQWFGNLVTSYGAHDHWLHEGFATYYSWLIEAEFLGKERLEEIKYKAQQNIIWADKFDKYPLEHSKAGSSRFYDKGAWILYMLRNHMGDSSYNAGIIDYLDRYKYNLVNTMDFQKAMEAAHGESLQIFFDQWVRRVGIPTVEVKGWQEGTKIKLEITQRQPINAENKAYELSIPLEIITDKRTYAHQLFMNKQVKKLTQNLADETLKSLVIDKNHTQLVNWNWNIPRAWVISLLEQDSVSEQTAYMIPALGAYAESDSEWIKNLSIKEWSPILQEAFMDWLMMQQDTWDEKVVKGILPSLKRQGQLRYLKGIEQIPVSHQKEIQKWLVAPSYDVIASALFKLCMSFPENSKSYLTRTKDIDGTRGNNVAVYRHLLWVVEGDMDHLEDLVNLTGEQHDFMTRMNALDALSALGMYIDEHLSENLFQMVFQGNRRLRNSGRKYLSEVYQDEEKQKVILATMSQLKVNWSDKQHEIIEKLLQTEEK